MRSILHIFFAILLVAAAVGVVRPHSVRLAGEAWEPVVRGQRVPATSGETVELKQSGSYIVFLDGPSNDAMGDRQDLAWVELVDRQSNQPLPATSQGVDYSYEFEGRSGRALARVTTRSAGVMELNVSRSDSDDLAARGFQVVVSASSVVGSQSGKATAWIVGGIAVCVIMGIFALCLVTSRSN